MNNLAVTNLQHIHMGQKQPKTFNNIYYRQNSHGDIFIKSSPSFQGNMAQKSVEVVTKNKKGFLATIAAFLGLVSAKSINNTEKTVIDKAEKQIIPAPPKPIVKEFSDSELSGITEWESQNKTYSKELRDLIKHSENCDKSRYLTKAEVLFLANKLSENPDLIRGFIKSNPYCDAREIVDLLEIYKRRPTSFDIVKRKCPFASAKDIESVMDIYDQKSLRERETLDKYNTIKELRYKMSKIQNDSNQAKTLKEMFDRYKWLSPKHIKDQLLGISINDVKIEDLPMMTTEDLVKELQYIKSPESKADILKERFNTPLRPYVDPLLKK